MYEYERVKAMVWVVILLIVAITVGLYNKMLTHNQAMIGSIVVLAIYYVWLVVSGIGSGSGCVTENMSMPSYRGSDDIYSPPNPQQFADITNEFKTEQISDAMKNTLAKLNPLLINAPRISIKTYSKNGSDGDVVTEYKTDVTGNMTSVNRINDLSLMYPSNAFLKTNMGTYYLYDGANKQFMTISPEFKARQVYTSSIRRDKLQLERVSKNKSGLYYIKDSKNYYLEGHGDGSVSVSLFSGSRGQRWHIKTSNISLPQSMLDNDSGDNSVDPSSYKYISIQSRHYKTYLRSNLVHDSTTSNVYLGPDIYFWIIYNSDLPSPNSGSGGSSAEGSQSVEGTESFGNMTDSQKKSYEKLFKLNSSGFIPQLWNGRYFYQETTASKNGNPNNFLKIDIKSMGNKTSDSGSGSNAQYQATGTITDMVRNWSWTVESVGPKFLSATRNSPTPGNSKIILELHDEVGKIPYIQAVTSSIADSNKGTPFNLMDPFSDQKNFSVKFRKYIGYGTNNSQLIGNDLALANNLIPKIDMKKGVGLPNVDLDDLTCKKAMNEYGVIPFETDGTMPSNIKNFWDKNSCDFNDEVMTCCHAKKWYEMVPGFSTGSANTQVQQWFTKKRCKAGGCSFESPHQQKYNQFKWGPISLRSEETGLCATGNPINANVSMEKCDNSNPYQYFDNSFGDKEYGVRTVSYKNKGNSKCLSMNKKTGTLEMQDCNNNSQPQQLAINMTDLGANLTLVPDNTVCLTNSQENYQKVVGASCQVSASNNNDVIGSSSKAQTFTNYTMGTLVNPNNIDCGTCWGKLYNAADTSLVFSVMTNGSGMTLNPDNGSSENLWQFNGGNLWNNKYKNLPVGDTSDGVYQGSELVFRSYDERVNWSANLVTIQVPNSSAYYIANMNNHNLVFTPDQLTSGTIMRYQPINNNTKTQQWIYVQDKSVSS